MELKNLEGTSYAEPLKAALIARRDGTATAQTDTDLGNIAFSIAQWAIGTAVRKGKLYRTFSQDPDFQGDIVAEVVEYMDLVDCERAPKEILVYLYNVARHCIKDRIRYFNADKRQHDEVPFGSMVATANIYGERTSAVADEGGVDGAAVSESIVNGMLARYAAEFKINI